MKKNLIVLIFALFIFAAIPASATISNLNNSNTFVANGATTSFTWNFPAVSSADLQVILTNSSGQQTTLLPSQYTVALNPINTGDLWSVGGVLVYPLSGPPLASGNSLTITRILPLQQTTDISNQGNFYPTVVEEALDTELMQTQQVNARTGQLRGTWVSGTLYNYGDIVVDGINGTNTSNLYLCAIPNTSGTWSTDLSNGDWSLALNVQGIINATPEISNNQLFANISGVAANPYGVGASPFLDSAFGNTQGDILYRSGSAWVPLAPGTSGQVLQSGGVAANPSWATVGGTGTITGVTAGTGLSGGGSSGNVTLALAGVANNSFLANINGGTLAPGPTTLSAFLDTVISSTQGSLLYRAGTNWIGLGPGSAGQILNSGGAAANPSWSGALANGTTATTQTSSDNSTKVATTAFVQTAVGGGSLPAPFAIGSYILACNNIEGGGCAGNANLAVGSTTSGANLITSPISDSIPGTWKQMWGQISPSGTGGIYLWQRIS